MLHCNRDNPCFHHTKQVSKLTFLQFPENLDRSRSATVTEKSSFLNNARLEITAQQQGNKTFYETYRNKNLLVYFVFRGCKTLFDPLRSTIMLGAVSEPVYKLANKLSDYAAISPELV